MSFLFWTLWLSYFLFIICVFSFTAREENISTKKKLIKRFPYFIASFLVLLFLSVKLTDSYNTIDIGLSLVLISIPFLIYSLFLLKKVVAQSNWFLLLFVPIAYCFILWVAHNNTPTHTGAMEGFGWAVSVIITFFGLFLLYPIFVFLLTMLKLNNILKGITLLAVSAISGILGISFSYGKEGYLADNSGGILFAFAVLVLAIWGLLHFSLFYRTIINPFLLYFRYYRNNYTTRHRK